MPSRFIRPQTRFQTEPGSILLEAVLAATAAVTTLAIIAPMFAQQIELAKRARDTDLIETAATQDVNAIRRFARYWRMKSGSYSQSYLNPNVTGGSYTQRTSGLITYSPLVLTECLTKDRFLINFLADLKNFQYANVDIVNYPQLFDVPRDITPPTLQSRYQLTRTLQRFRTDPGMPTLRLTYQLTPLNNAPPIAFERIAELQLEMQNAC
jgi:hypothetical protein